MAAYREHISVSSLLGVAYGAVSIVLGFTPVQGMLAAVVTGIGGMLPDLDSQTGTPVRELSALAAATLPVLMMQYLLAWGGDAERGLLAGVVMYFVVRYGGRRLLANFTVHRGMFHSTPAIGIAALVVFVLYRSDDITLKFLMGGGMAIGYLSHLVLDEVYSVEWSGARIRLKKSAGSALKSVGKSVSANVVTYGVLFGVSYAGMLQVTETLDQRPVPNAIVVEKQPPAPMFNPDEEGIAVAPVLPFEGDSLIPGDHLGEGSRLGNGLLEQIAEEPEDLTDPDRTRRN